MDETCILKGDVMTDQPEKNEPRHMQQVRLYQSTNGEEGGLSSSGLPVLLITTIGRKSRQPRTNPVVYMADGDTYIVIGSNMGREKHSNWYLNLKENPEVQIQIKADVFAATASEAEGEQREHLWEKFVAHAPSFKQYATATERRMPVIVLEPHT
jgi:deazaflavin-dependent oxidoreductase (nitroreductase family)